MQSFALLSLSLLLLIVTVSGAPTTPKPAPPPFLRNLSDSAKKEFYQISGNKSLTRLDLRNQVLAWADKNGVKSQVEDYLSRRNAAKAAQRERITAAIKELPDAYNNLNAIGDDDNISQNEADNKIKQTMEGYSWELKELLRLAGPGNQARKPAAAPGA